MQTQWKKKKRNGEKERNEQKKYYNILYFITFGMLYGLKLYDHSD